METQVIQGELDFPPNLLALSQQERSAIVLGKLEEYERMKVLLQQGAGVNVLQVADTQWKDKVEDGREENSLEKLMIYTRQIIMHGVLEKPVKKMGKRTRKWPQKG